MRLARAATPPCGGAGSSPNVERAPRVHRPAAPFPGPRPGLHACRRPASARAAGSAATTAESGQAYGRLAGQTAKRPPLAPPPPPSIASGSTRARRSRVWRVSLRLRPTDRSPGRLPACSCGSLTALPRNLPARREEVRPGQRMDLGKRLLGLRRRLVRSGGLAARVVPGTRGPYLAVPLQCRHWPGVDAATAPHPVGISSQPALPLPRGRVHVGRMMCALGGRTIRRMRSGSTRSAVASVVGSGTMNRRISAISA